MSGIFILIVLIDNSIYIDHDKIAYSHIKQECAYCDTCRTCAVYYNRNILHLLACATYRIDKRRTHYNGCSVLIVVEYGNIELFLKSAFDLKASRSGYILYIYTAEAVGYKLYRSNYLVNILRLYADRECVNACELFEQTSFTFHYGHTCKSAYITKTEYGSTVRDDRN